MPSYHEAKFKELVLFAAELVGDDPYCGAIKLNKVIYFSEFAQLRKTGSPISGAEMQNLHKGPAPHQLLPIRKELVAEGSAVLEKVDDGFGNFQHRLTPLRGPDLSMFEEHELETVREVAKRLRGLTGAQVSELSHRDAAWRLTQEGEAIPYATAFLDVPQVLTSKARDRLAALAAEPQ